MWDLIFGTTGGVALCYVLIVIVIKTITGGWKEDDEER